MRSYFGATSRRCRGSFGGASGGRSFHDFFDAELHLDGNARGRIEALDQRQCLLGAGNVRHTGQRFDVADVVGALQPPPDEGPCTS